MNADYEAQLAAMQGYVPPAASMPGEQQSPEWRGARLGNCTGSRFKDAWSFKKNGEETEKRATYRMECVIERLTGVPSEHYVSAPMEWGIEYEPAARMAYEARTGAMVLVPGYRPHPTIAKCGGSVDGLVDDDGLIEVKCPNTKTHILTLLNGMDDEHKPQVQGYIWITERKWCDFISYDPRLPAGLQLHIQRIMRDDDYIAELAGNVLTFLGEVDALHGKLLARIAA